MICRACQREVPESEIPTATGRCGDCERRRREVAYAELVMNTSEQVIELPVFTIGGLELEMGWATARCVLDVPYEWLCLHIHTTEIEAQECLNARSDLPA